MRWPTILIASAIAGMLSMSSVFAAGPFGTINIGQWSGGAFTDDRTGAFSHCASSALFPNDVHLGVGQNAQRVGLLTFSNGAWSLTPGETVPIDMAFDGQAGFRLFGTASSQTLITLILPNAVMNQLRNSHLMEATHKEFALTSIDKVVLMIANCVNRTKTDGVASAGNFSISPPKSPIKSNVDATATQPSPTKPTKLINVTGTGFVISANGHIVTNNHVISDCVGDVHGNLVGEGAVTLRIVAADRTNDLALLQASGSFKDTATIRRTAVHSGDTIIAIGYPFHGLLTSGFTVTTGIVSSLSGVFNDTRFLQISAPVQPGNSGGPLLDTSGNIVGVVAEKLNALTMVKATGNIPET